MAFRKILVGACVGGALFVAGAMIAPVLAADRSGGDARSDLASASWHKQMCTDRYAHNAGQIAFIEVKLSLTDSQRPLFDSWKQTVLRSAQARESACLARQAHGGQHNILERPARVMQRLQHRMADMTAERPSFETLYNALSPKQRKAFEHDGRMGPGGRGPQGHDHWIDHGHHDAPDDKA